jgi:hypothetical protein
MPLSSDHVAHLVTALLAVNQYPLDRAAKLIPAFRAQGLLNPARLAAMEQEAAIKAMTEAGYARGGYLPIVSFRLYKLMEAVAAGQLDELEKAAATGDRQRFDTVLSGIHGFGPATTEAAWSLCSEGG